MKFSITNYHLEFKTPFAIAHGTRTGTDLIFLKIEDKGIIAFGEASLPPYLPDTQESVHRFINSFFHNHADLSKGLAFMLNELMNFDEGNFAAKACVDIALHNWFAQKAGVPVWEMLELENVSLPLCTFTIGMDTPAEIKRKVEEAGDFKLLKVKLGGENDRDIITAIREVTNKPLCVDVNQGWQNNKEMALEMIEWLKDRGVIFVEQPLDKNDVAGQTWLHERSPLPVIADEAVQVPADIRKIKDIYNGVNIKLMKCGGIGEGLKMIRLAREYGLKVLVGSMSESGCAITAAANLASLADWVDLDGPLLTKNNPFDIVKYKDGKVVI
ncbi:MAG: dipeptide epimerase [Bacteroidota bacterium]|nr:dipeptide epimerase [Bacteroidota bacterium]